MEKETNSCMPLGSLKTLWGKDAISVWGCIKQTYKRVEATG